MVAAPRSVPDPERFSSAERSPYFVIHRTNFAALLAIPRHRRKHALAAFAVLSAHVDGRTGETFVSYGTIAREAGMARSTTIDAVKTLAEHGLLAITERYDARGDRASNLYRLVVLPAVALAEDSGSQSRQGVVRRTDSIEHHPDQTLKTRARPVDSNATPPMLLRDDREAPATLSPDTGDWHRSLARDLGCQLYDKGSLAATATRLRNLHQTSGLSRDDFLKVIYEARGRTQKHGGGIAYLCAVVEDLTGVKPRPAPSRPHLPAAARPTSVPVVTASLSLPCSVETPPDETWAALRALGIPDAGSFWRQFGVLPARVTGALNDPWAKVAYARDRLGGEVARQ